MRKRFETIKTSFFIVILMPILLIIFVSAPSAQARPADVIAVIDGDTLFKLLEPDAIPAIRNPQFVSGAAADSQMSPEEPVLGLEYKGEYRAYSLWQLDHHEIVNDFIGDTPIAVTW